MALNPPSRPIIFITGGNSGVGYGIALRLLRQLSTPRPSDIDPFQSEYSTPAGATIILACRNAIKAHKARTALLYAIGKIDKGSRWKAERKRRVLKGESEDGDVPGDEDEHGNGNGILNELGEYKVGIQDDAVSVSKRVILSDAEWKRKWLDGLRIEFVPLDLSSVESVFHCVQEVKSRYPYVTHLMLNAGGGPFKGLYWSKAVWLCLTDLLNAVTYPNYLKEHTGLITEDGLGWTWQCNVFGHYLLARELLPHLLKAPHKNPKIIWTGSLDGLPSHYISDDYQGVDSGCSYQMAKYQIALAGWGFNRVIQDVERDSGVTEPKVTSWVVHPGVVGGNMFYEIIGPILDLCMKLSFYLARLLGSPHHAIDPRKAAMAFVYVALAPISLLYHVMNHPNTLTPGNASRSEPQHVQPNPKNPDKASTKSGNGTVDKYTWLPIRFGARCTRWGREYVGIDVVHPGMDHDPDNDPFGRADGAWWSEKESDLTVERCERLRDAFLRKRRGGEGAD